MESLGCICKSWMGYDHEADLGSHPHWSMGQQCDLSRHPQQRWDCDMYYEPDADQTSGLSYTCHAVFQMVPQPLKFEHCSKRLLVEDCMGFYQFYYQFYYQYWGLSESILGAAGFAAHLCSFEGIELFDCKFFDISPAEARGSGHGLFFHPSEWVEHVEHVAGMDPTQRQVLEARDHSAFNSSLNFLH